MMHELLFKKIDELISLLDGRKNPSADFFENAKKKLQTNYNDIDELNSLIKCYAITQYANFSEREEDLLNQVIDLARDIRDQINSSSKKP